MNEQTSLQPTTQTPAKAQSFSGLTLDMAMLTDEHRPNADWEVVYGIEKLYLTNSEREYLINALNKGVKYVNIGGLTLTGSFTHIKPNQLIAKRLAEAERAKRLYG